MGNELRGEEERRNEATGAPARETSHERAQVDIRSKGIDDHSSERTSETAEEVVFRVRHLALVSSNYHKAREAFLEKSHRVMMLFVLILGSAAAGDLLEDFVRQEVLAFAAAFAGAIDMTYAFGRQARDHALLGAKFVELIGDLTGIRTREDADRAESRFYAICASEPPVFEAVAALAYNQALAVIPDQKHLKLHVPWCHWLVRNLVRFSNRTYAPK